MVGVSNRGRGRDRNAHKNEEPAAVGEANERMCIKSGSWFVWSCAEPSTTRVCVWLIGDWWLVVTRWRSLLLEVHNVVGQLS